MEAFCEKTSMVIILLRYSTPAEYTHTFFAHNIKHQSTRSDLVGTFTTERRRTEQCCINAVKYARTVHYCWNISSPLF